MSPTYLGEGVVVWKHDRQQCAYSNQVLHLERVQVRVVGRFVVIQHEVHGIGGGADEDNLEDGVVQHLGLVEGP